VTQEFEYDGFISYRRAESKDLAQWLRQRLQRYRLPASLGRSAKPLRLYLDTAFERATEDFWANNIAPALRKSRFLIVLITPSAYEQVPAGRQNWMQREAELFLSLTHGRNIIVARAAGRPEDPLPPTLSERFPQAHVADLSSFRARRRLRPSAPELADGFLAIAAVLHGVPENAIPVLKQEEERHRRKIAARVAAGLFALVLLLSGLSVYALIQRSEAIQSQREAEYRRRVADDQRAAAERERARADRESEVASEQRDLANKREIQAEAERDRAVRAEQDAKARYLAGQATLLEPQAGQLGLAALLAVEAHSRKPLFEARVVMARLLTLMRRSEMLLTHGATVTEAVVGPGGQWLATASFDKYARIWDLATGRERLRLAHQGRLTTIAATNAGDRIATGSEDGTASVFDTGTGEGVVRFEHKGKVNAVRTSPDGEWLAVATDDGSVSVWRLKDRGRVEFQHRGVYPWLMGVTPDSQRVVTAGGETLQIREALTGVATSTLELRAKINSISLSRDGSLLATACEDGEIRLLDAKTGRERLRAFTGSNAYSIEIGPSGDWFAVGGMDGLARIYDTRTGRLRQSLRHQYYFVTKVRTTDDDTQLITQTFDGVVRLWDVITGQEQARIEARASLQAVTKDGKRLTTGNHTGDLINPGPYLLRVWEIEKGRDVRRLMHDADITSVAITADGKRLYTGGQKGTVWAWDPVAARELKRFGGLDEAYRVATNQDGSLLAVATSNGVVRIIDAATGRERTQFHHNLSSNVSGRVLNNLAFTPDGRWIVTAVADAHARFWNPATGVEEARVSHRTDLNFLYNVAFTSDRRSLITTGFDDRIKFWDLATRKETADYNHRAPVRAVATSSAMGWMASVGDDRTAKVWDLKTGKERLMLAHDAIVAQVAISPDDKWLATGSIDGKIRVWDAESGDEYIRIQMPSVPQGLFLPTRDGC
jgi:WD40 repeat protein